MDEMPTPPPGCTGTPGHCELESLRSALTEELVVAQRRRAEIGLWVEAQRRWFGSMGEALQQDAWDRAELRRLLADTQLQLTQLTAVLHTSHTPALAQPGAAQSIKRWWRRSRP